jgi:hypothetical protein
MGILGQPIPVSVAAGTQRNIPARDIPQSLNALKISLDGSTITNPATHAVLTVDYSPDGVLWATEAVSEVDKAACVPFPIVWEFQGGMTDRAGNLITDLFVETGPFPDGIARQVRGTLQVTGAALSTTATISAEQIVRAAKLK